MINAPPSRSHSLRAASARDESGLPHNKKPLNMDRRFADCVSAGVLGKLDRFGLPLLHFAAYSQCYVLVRALAASRAALDDAPPCQNCLNLCRAKRVR